MARNRLTTRQAADQTPYPGNVNQPDRKDPAMDQYDNFEQQINYELQDLRTDWRDNPRDEIGFGIPKQASIRLAASKAVRMAVLMLGDKVAEEVIEAQARDFMAMTHKAMDRTLQRFADTQKFYAEDVEEKPVEKPAEEKPVVAEEKKMPDFIQEKIDAKKDKEEAGKGEEKAASEQKPVVAEQKPVVAEEKPAEEKKDDDVVAMKAAIAELTARVAAMAAPVKAAVEVKAEKDELEDIEVQPEAPAVELTEKAASDELPEDAEADAELAAMFDDEDKDKVPVEAGSKKASKYVKKLGGQPIMASERPKDEFDGLWADAPDVSEVFR